MRRESSPFGRHLLYYLIVKYAAIAAAVFVSLYDPYLLYSD
jgi:hypothetical protein